MILDRYQARKPSRNNDPSGRSRIFLRLSDERDLRSPRSSTGHVRKESGSPGLKAKLPESRTRRAGLSDAPPRPAGT